MAARRAVRGERKIGRVGVAPPRRPLVLAPSEPDAERGESDSRPAKSL
jgi:hypothetical protein